MKQSYIANSVKTHIAYGKPGFATRQFKSFDAEHNFTILSKEKDIINWQDEISFNFEGEIEKYTIYGVGYEKKVGNKTFYELNGSGVFPSKFRINNTAIEVTFNVYSKMSGELCKNGNIKFTLNEDSETNKIKLNGIEILDNNTYASVCNFCAKKILK
jgi:hypothetical protein